MLFTFLNTPEIEQIRKLRTDFFFEKSNFLSLYKKMYHAYEKFARSNAAKTNPGKLDSGNNMLAVMVQFYNTSEQLLSVFEALYESAAWTYGATTEQRNGAFLEELQQYVLNDQEAAREAGNTQRVKLDTDVFLLLQKISDALTLYSVIPPDVIAYEFTENGNKFLGASCPVQITKKI